MSDILKDLRECMDCVCIKEASIGASLFGWSEAFNIEWIMDRVEHKEWGATWF
ncbi:MAG: hypothetical protein AAF429_10295 [Pseudomonadota bacterium]